jgi:hypothetical protein
MLLVDDRGHNLEDPFRVNQGSRDSSKMRLHHRVNKKTLGGLPKKSAIINVPDKRDWGQPACPMVWKKYEEENE